MLKKERIGRRALAQFGKEKRLAKGSPPTRSEHAESSATLAVVIQQDRWKQAEFEWRAGSEPLDDLPGTLILFVRVGAHEIEVELIGVDFGQEIAAASELFQIEELVFFEAVHGFDVALVGVRRGRDAHVLAVAEGFGEVAFELAAVVGLPDESRAERFRSDPDAAECEKRRPRWQRRCVFRRMPRTAIRYEHRGRCTEWRASRIAEPAASSGGYRRDPWYRR